MNSPILGQPDYKREFILMTDASIKGLGVVLAQEDDNGNEVVIEYASRATRGAEVNYTITELECLAIVWAVEHFRRYLVGRKFKIVAALKILKKPNEAKGIRARWKMRLMPYNFEIIHRAGRDNSNADALLKLIGDKKKEPVIVIIDGVDGVGKSTVVKSLIEEWKKKELSVRFNTFKRRRQDKEEFKVPRKETEWKFRREVVEQINKRMFVHNNEDIIILDKSPYCEYFYQKTKSFDRGLIDDIGNEKMEDEIFRYKNIIDESIVIFLENDRCWENYISRETKKNEKSSYNTLNKKEYMDMVKMFKEHQYVYDNTRKYKKIKIKNDDMSWKQLRSSEDKNKMDSEISRKEIEFLEKLLISQGRLSAKLQRKNKELRRRVDNLENQIQELLCMRGLNKGDKNSEKLSSRKQYRHNEYTRLPKNNREQK
jgi:thymidylate kinase